MQLLRYQNHFHMMQSCTVKVNAELHFGIFGCGTEKGLNLGRAAIGKPILQSMLLCQQSCKMIRENA